MPYPGVPDELTEKMERCVEDVMADGHDKSSAIAICKSRIVGDKALLSGAVLSHVPIRAVGDNAYEAYAIVFGSPENRDMYGTYFDAATRYYLDWWESLPWLYHHGINEGTPLTYAMAKTGAQRIGTWTDRGMDDVGVFVQGELDLRHEYIEYVKHLLDVEGVLFPSSGTLETMMSIGGDGHVEDWPIAEVSSTVAPAELRMRPISPAGMSALRALSAIPEGRYTMALPERLQEILGRRAADVTIDGESVEDVLDEDAEVEETEADVEETEEQETEEQEGVEEMAEAIARHLGLGEVLGDVVRAFGQLDEAVEELTGRVDGVEEVIVGLARDEPTRVKSLLSDPGWRDKLFVASRSGDTVDEDEEQEVVQANQRSEDEGGVFSRIRVDA